MDFNFTETQKEQQAAMAAFARQSLNCGFEERESGALFDRKLWQLCAAQGVLSMTMPAAITGVAPIDILTAVIAMEGLGQGSADNGLPFALSTHLWTVQHPIMQFGSAEQQQRYLPGMCSGELLGAHAMTEPEAGSDSSAMQTVAIKVDGGYVLSGHKCMISLAPVADMFLLFASTSPEHGKWGITAFLVDRESKGLQVTAPANKMGLRTVPMGQLDLDDCFVPESLRLGPEGAGASISNKSLELERCCLLASQVGRMQQQLDDSVKAARNRKQFGRSIGQFQSVSNRIADMQVRLETARQLLYKVAWMKSEGMPTVMESAMLKLVVSEYFLTSSIDAMRVHGGRSYLAENVIEHDVRDSIGGVLYAGTSDIQRNIIAGMLGLETDV